MATAQLPAPALRWARSPFYFYSSATLIKIGREKATNLAELLEGLRACPDASIFQHTFQTLRDYHFIREGWSNDFGHWAFAACNEVALAEQLSALDVREFTSVKDLRERLVATVEKYLKKNPRSADRPAFEAFYFCASEAVMIPTPYVARNLKEFAEAMRKVGLHTIHHHFIAARLRLKLNSNDFSVWLENELDLGKLADKINRIDIYTATLEDVRQAIIRVVEQGL
ncbi:MAG: DUF5752 family protein [Acidobacteriota bacterium]|nr:DUF5752 family protein [Acidobacteriota bacterium]